MLQVYQCILYTVHMLKVKKIRGCSIANPKLINSDKDLDLEEKMLDNGVLVSHRHTG